MDNNKREIRTATNGQAVCVVALILASLIIGFTVLKVDGIIMLTVAAVIAGLFAFYLGYSWDDITGAVSKKIAEAMPAILILLSIGLLVGTWMAGGVIPAMIYYGLKIVNPNFLLLTAFWVSVFISIATGTSWGTVGTIGVALIGVGVGLGVPLPMVAGAVITVYPGASPERVESEVSDVMENALGTVSGVESITATSAENYSLLLMKFAEGTDMNSAMVKTSNKHLVAYYADTCNNAELTAVLKDVLDTPVSPELLPPVEGNIAQKTEDLVGPYELHDFFLYYMLRCGYAPDKVYRIARETFEGKYDDPTIRKWLKNFYRRFFTQQFKRSCLPDGPKVGSVALSPRGDLRMPSDACARIWLDQLEEI